MEVKNGTVAFLLLHTSQNVDNVDDLLVYIGNYIEGIFVANGSSKEAAMREVNRYLKHVYADK